MNGVDSAGQDAKYNRIILQITKLEGIVYILKIVSLYHQQGGYFVFLADTWVVAED